MDHEDRTELLALSQDNLEILALQALMVLLVTRETWDLLGVPDLLDRLDQMVSRVYPVHPVHQVHPEDPGHKVRPVHPVRSVPWEIEEDQARRVYPDFPDRLARKDPRDSVDDLGQVVLPVRPDLLVLVERQGVQDLLDLQAFQVPLDLLDNPGMLVFPDNQVYRVQMVRKEMLVGPGLRVNLETTELQEVQEAQGHQGCLVR